MPATRHSPLITRHLKMSKKPPPPSSEGGAPEWMVSYADMITIVLAFFVVLYPPPSGSGKQDKGHSTNDAPASESKNDQPPQEKGEGSSSSGSDENAELQKVFKSLYDRFGPNWTAANCWQGGPPAFRGPG